MSSLRVSIRTVVALLAVASAQEQPLLSTIAGIPELSTFSTVVNGSGGNKLNPALEERFNSKIDGRKYTAFVPTNDAFAKIPSAFVGALTAAPAYPLLEAIIRTHIAEGQVNSGNLTSSSPIIAIEGFPLSITTTQTNAILINKQAQRVGDETPASNGVVHRIDQVLNPFTGYFGVSNTSSAPAQSSQVEGTISDILSTDQRLSTIRDVLLALQPDLIQNRLRLSSPQQQQIFTAPSNAAFAAAPPGTPEASKAPSNQPLSFQLFSFGLLNNPNPTAKLADLNLAGGSAQRANSFTGINVTVSQKTPEGAVFVNNAAVEGEVCGSNGCVWLVDRILDPLYLVFGPLDRA
ncbi:hypothetical protein HYFRA_00009465 [Hymenoscyphus fraxineus]|uniref:FAS1 domain-containing protein n=1 Tax=Hymenoscyphus fraxineus TaxID=746836 RepID=A0A9N9KZN7_9HELO|nr:hypothetical protein HYFRA_00009465 [Hymenoscyphus fraxineus]